MSGTRGRIQYETNIIVVGKPGNGKSATCNSVLRSSDAFKSSRSPRRVTTKSECQESIVDREQLYRVVDTPGLFGDPEGFVNDALHVQDSIIKLRERNASVHVFLLVLSCRNRFTREEKMIIDLLKIIFGDNFIDHTIVVFTNTKAIGDDTTLREFYQKDPELDLLIKTFNERIVGIDNESQTGFDDLYVAVRSMQLSKGPYHFDFGAKRKILNDMKKIESSIPPNRRGDLYEVLDRMKGNFISNITTGAIYACVGAMASLAFIRR